MFIKARISVVGVSLLAGALFAAPALAQVSPSGSAAPSPTAPAPTSAQISSFAQSVGINETCARAYLAANGNVFPQTLSALTQFMTLAPAADLCSPGAVASAANNTPTPTAAQQTAYAQSTGVNVDCIHAFVLHANSLPLSQAELNQFQQLAPASDLCTQAAVSSAQAAAASPKP